MAACGRIINDLYDLSHVLCYLLLFKIPSILASTGPQPGLVGHLHHAVLPLPQGPLVSPKYVCTPHGRRPLSQHVCYGIQPATVIDETSRELQTPKEAIHDRRREGSLKV